MTSFDFEKRNDSSSLITLNGNNNLIEKIRLIFEKIKKYGKILV